VLKSREDVVGLLFGLSAGDDDVSRVEKQECAFGGGGFEDASGEESRFVGCVLAVHCVDRLDVYFEGEVYGCDDVFGFVRHASGLYAVCVEDVFDVVYCSNGVEVCAASGADHLAGAEEEDCASWVAVIVNGGCETSGVVGHAGEGPCEVEEVYRAVEICDHDDVLDDGVVRGEIFHRYLGDREGRVQAGGGMPLFWWCDRGGERRVVRDVDRAGCFVDGIQNPKFVTLGVLGKKGAQEGKYVAVGRLDESELRVSVPGSRTVVRRVPEDAKERTLEVVVKGGLAGFHASVSELVIVLKRGDSKWDSLTVKIHLWCMDADTARLSYLNAMESVFYKKGGVVHEDANPFWRHVKTWCEGHMRGDEAGTVDAPDGGLTHIQSLLLGFITRKDVVVDLGTRQTAVGVLVAKIRPAFEAFGAALSKMGFWSCVRLDNECHQIILRTKIGRSDEYRNVNERFSKEGTKSQNSGRGLALEEVKHKYAFLLGGLYDCLTCIREQMYVVFMDVWGIANDACKQANPSCIENTTHRTAYSLARMQFECLAIDRLLKTNLSFVATQVYDGKDSITKRKYVTESWDVKDGPMWDFKTALRSVKCEALVRLKLSQYDDEHTYPGARWCSYSLYNNVFKSFANKYRECSDIRKKLLHTHAPWAEAFGHDWKGFEEYLKQPFGGEMEIATMGQFLSILVGRTLCDIRKAGFENCLGVLKAKDVRIVPWDGDGGNKKFLKSLLFPPYIDFDNVFAGTVEAGSDTITTPNLFGTNLKLSGLKGKELICIQGPGRIKAGAVLKKYEMGRLTTSQTNAGEGAVLFYVGKFHRGTREHQKIANAIAIYGYDPRTVGFSIRHEPKKVDPGGGKPPALSVPGRRRRREPGMGSQLGYTGTKIADAWISGGAPLSRRVYSDLRSRHFNGTDVPDGFVDVVSEFPTVCSPFLFGSAILEDVGTVETVESEGVFWTLRRALGLKSERDAWKLAVGAIPALGAYANRGFDSFDLVKGAMCAEVVGERIGVPLVGAVAFKKTTRKPTEEDVERIADEMYDRCCTFLRTGTGLGATTFDGLYRAFYGFDRGVCFNYEQDRTSEDGLRLGLVHWRIEDILNNKGKISPDWIKFQVMRYKKLMFVGFGVSAFGPEQQILLDHFLCDPKSGWLKRCLEQKKQQLGWDVKVVSIIKDLGILLRPIGYDVTFTLKEKRGELSGKFGGLDGDGRAIVTFFDTDRTPSSDRLEHLDLCDVNFPELTHGFLDEVVIPTRHLMHDSHSKKEEREMTACAVQHQTSDSERHYNDERLYWMPLKRGSFDIVLPDELKKAEIELTNKLKEVTTRLEAERDEENKATLEAEVERLSGDLTTRVEEAKAFVKNLVKDVKSPFFMAVFDISDPGGDVRCVIKEFEEEKWYTAIDLNGMTKTGRTTGDDVTRLPFFECIEGGKCMRCGAWLEPDRWKKDEEMCQQEITKTTKDEGGDVYKSREMCGGAYTPVSCFNLLVRDGTCVVFSRLLAHALVVGDAKGVNKVTAWTRNFSAGMHNLTTAATNFILRRDVVDASESNMDTGSVPAARAREKVATLDVGDFKQAVGFSVPYVPRWTGTGRWEAKGGVKMVHWLRLSRPTGRGADEYMWDIKVAVLQIFKALELDSGWKDVKPSERYVDAMFDAVENLVTATGQKVWFEYATLIEEAVYSHPGSDLVFQRIERFLCDLQVHVTNKTIPGPGSLHSHAGRRSSMAIPRIPASCEKGDFLKSTEGSLSTEKSVDGVLWRWMCECESASISLGMWKMRFDDLGGRKCFEAVKRMCMGGVRPRREHIRRFKMMVCVFFFGPKGAPSCLPEYRDLLTTPALREAGKQTDGNGDWEVVQEVSKLDLMKPRSAGEEEDDVDKFITCVKKHVRMVSDFSIFTEPFQTDTEKTYEEVCEWDLNMFRGAGIVQSLNMWLLDDKRIDEAQVGTAGPYIEAVFLAWEQKREEGDLIGKRACAQYQISKESEQQEQHAVTAVSVESLFPLMKREYRGDAQLAALLISTLRKLPRCFLERASAVVHGGGTLHAA